MEEKQRVSSRKNTNKNYVNNNLNTAQHLFNCDDKRNFDGKLYITLKNIRV